MKRLKLYLPLLLLLGAYPLLAAISVTQTGFCQTGGTTCSFTKTMTGGQYVYFGGTGTGGSTLTLSMTGANTTCTTLNPDHQFSTFNEGHTCIITSDSAGSTTFTCTSAVNTNFVECGMIEISGVNANDQLSVHDNTSTVSHFGTALTTTQANSIIVGLVSCSANASGAWSNADATTFTVDAGLGTSGGITISYRIVSSTGTYTPGATSTSGCDSTVFDANFYQSSGATSTPHSGAVF